MKWNNDIFKRYMEAGLAILIVLTLGLAGAAGVLSPRATEREQNETAAENDSTKASQENENKTSASNPDTEEAQEAIAARADQTRSWGSAGRTVMISVR